MDKIFTIGIGGAAGDGVKKAGIKIGQFLADRGYEIYLSFAYPSLIKGGHNFARLSFGKEKIWSDRPKLDLLAVSNEESLELHRGELKDGTRIISNIPLSKISEDPSVIWGEEISKTAFDTINTKNELIDGNTAFAKGLLAGGLDFYFAYPMTPSTSILHYLAGRQKEANIKVIQPENEISVINMALGAAYAGKRSAVGTATGGFALMHEAFSFAGMAELPLIIAVSQRQAPATGVPTRSSQSDLRSVIYAGHGEFPRIVLLPGDPEESFRAGAEALNLAWKFKTPVSVLLDKVLSEHMMTVRAEEFKEGKMERSKEENEKNFPGMPDKVIRINSYEHDEYGFTIDRTEDIKRMIDKRFEKAEIIEREIQGRETVKSYGDKNSENILVFWGSTKGAAFEALKNLDKPVKLLQIMYAEPFPSEKIKEELSGRRAICIEGNHDGQMASLIREKTGIEIRDKILKYDSTPFDPEELAMEINKLI